MLIIALPIEKSFFFFCRPVLLVSTLSALLSEHQIYVYSKPCLIRPLVDSALKKTLRSSTHLFYLKTNFLLENFSQMWSHCVVKFHGANAARESSKNGLYAGGGRLEMKNH